MNRILLVALGAATVAGCGQPGPSEVEEWWAARQAQNRAIQEHHKAVFASRQIIRQVPKDLQTKSAAYIKDQLEYPHSARFRYDFMTVGGETDAVCGAVNARSSYGGYAGMKRFYVEFTNGQAIGGELIARYSVARLAELCGYTDPNFGRPY